MAEMMQFDLVSPERRLTSVQASEVQIPGAEGDFTAMAQHAPVITTLRPGVLKVVTTSGTEEYLVTGGFAEVGAAGTSVLAERAFAKADVTPELLEDLIKEANLQRDASNTDMAAKYADDLVAASTQIAG
ncbi:ATP synthase F1 subcomplex epsilon subunit [Litoreibacter meonggei]|uniref:ATP synthase epsilon chain n=1 Tax=Litoreibacter meonggei TaxID=1049199 RepID=A0A497X6C0_9RHOB|nr:F0F1 ATP synthase subunit epsilon [Litoreibacter meonggei]RLJ60651.1 ATP synthase F1 subcomplex epsilon subunit [Litoreibacter meonggei]